MIDDRFIAKFSPPIAISFAFILPFYFKLGYKGDEKQKNRKNDRDVFSVKKRKEEKRRD